MKKTPLPPPIANLATAILGIWKLKSREDVDSIGRVRIDPFFGQSSWYTLLWSNSFRSPVHET